MGNKKSKHKKISYGKPEPIKVVDLFAGPGGLGEGFSASGHFNIVVSAEMESSAHSTLRLRAFYRKLRQIGELALQPYFDICNGKTTPPTAEKPLDIWDEQTKNAWIEACNEALQLTLGNAEDNEKLDQRISQSGVGRNAPWILIGGPPCQAYSIVGRARNKGKEDYRAEDDHRHFLYKEYLRIIARYKPSIFVMENVKGILSSKIGEQHIFHNILRDLAAPDVATKTLSVRATGYRIYSLSTDVCFTRHDKPDEIDARDFIVYAEKYGVPQARHRVILLGVREDICQLMGPDWSPGQLSPAPKVTVENVLETLPRLRSTLSRRKDNESDWKEVVVNHARELATEAMEKGLDSISIELKKLSKQEDLANQVSSNEPYQRPTTGSAELNNWLAGDGVAKRLSRHLNHESRGHMESDLRRYAFASVFARVHKRSPKGHSEFSLKGLAPAHENWETGKFADRFRVQLATEPATTVTSHIAKDGHYFIHYDPSQCRSLTVREAARLQTFPDDYYFQGNRTQQYHQVGNAVPPYLAHKIEQCVRSILKEYSKRKHVKRVNKTKAKGNRT